MLKMFMTDTRLVQVRLMDESDYMKHVSAEKSMYSHENSSNKKTSASGNEIWQAPSNSGGHANSQQEKVKKREAQQPDVGSHLKPFQKRQPDAERVAATTSDEEADKLWGSKQVADPEFYI
jgi:hypothetical protein